MKALEPEVLNWSSNLSLPQKLFLQEISESPHYKFKSFTHGSNDASFAISAVITADIFRAARNTLKSRLSVGKPKAIDDNLIFAEEHKNAYSIEGVHAAIQELDKYLSKEIKPTNLRFSLTEFLGKKHYFFVEYRP